MILLSVLQEEIEEDDGDSIEKVLWHQPKGMAEDAQRNNRSTEPVLLSHLFDSEIYLVEIVYLEKNIDIIFVFLIISCLVVPICRLR